MDWSEPEVVVEEPKPNPSLPDDWPTFPEPFGPEWTAMPRPFGQVHEDDSLAACRDCGGSEFVMILFVRGIRDATNYAAPPHYHQESSIQCPKCMRIPKDAITVGHIDGPTGRMTLLKRDEIESRESK